MLKLLLGPVLLGAGYAMGSYYGADAEQLVRKDPSSTYEALEQALANIPARGTTSFAGGAPIPYEIDIERTPGKRLDLAILFAGRRGADVEMALSELDGGHDTMMTARIHADRAVLRMALAGTDKARLAYAPDWMLNLSLKPLLSQLAGEIERGEIAKVEDPSPAGAEARWEAGLNDEDRNRLAEYREYQATQPAVDPETAAQNLAERTNN